MTFTIAGSGVNWVSIKDETCLEVPNRDISAYAKAIDRLIKDEKLHQRLSENGFQRVNEMFVLSKEIEACKKCYENVR